jgi:lysophospholipase L1-like esterase
MKPSRYTLFTAVAIILCLLMAEGVVRTGIYLKRRSLKKDNPTSACSGVELELLKMRKERESSTVKFGEFATLSPDLFIIKEDKFYKPIPDTTSVMMVNGKIDHIFMPLTPELEALLGSFEGEVYRYNYDRLSLRENGRRRVRKAGPDGGILMIGDSFTEGCYVNDEDTIPARLESYIEDTGPGVDVFNAGVSGYSTKEEYYRLEELFDQLTPRLVILNYYANDVGLEENKVIGSWRAKGPRNAVGRWIFENLAIAKEPMKLYYSVFSRPADPDRDDDVRRGWAESFRYLTGIHRLCKRKGAQLILSAIPTKDQYISGVKRYYQDKLQAYCLKEGIAFLDPYEFLKERGALELYLSWDPHFNRKGYDAYAGFLYYELKNNGLLHKLSAPIK